MSRRRESTPAGSRLRRALRRCFIGLAMACVAGEIGLRVWDHHHGRTGALYDYVIPVGTRFKMRPDSAVIVPERYGDIRYHFNHQGYRDNDHDQARNAPRLVWLGDSVTFGLGVAQDRTYAARIGWRLAGMQPPWDTVNLAIFAYDTRHELETLKEDGLKYHPRVIVLEFFMNDLALSSPTPAVSRPTWTDRLTALKNRLVYKSALYLRAQQLLLGTSYLLLHDARRQRFPETLNADEPRGQLAYLRSHPADNSVPTFAALSAIDREARQHHASLLVFISPDEVQLFTRRYDLINQRVGGFCSKQGIATFDPLPVLRASPRRTRLFLDGVHYSDEGHGVIARLIFEALDRGGFLAGRPG